LRLLGGEGREGVAHWERVEFVEPEQRSFAVTSTPYQRL